jgi:hypothetical protein
MMRSSNRFGIDIYNSPTIDPRMLQGDSSMVSKQCRWFMDWEV